MNRPLIAVIFIIVAVCIAVTSLFYINNTHETMTEHLGDVLESAIADNKQETKIRLDNALKEWEKKDDLLNVFIGQTETNDVKNALSMAVHFSEIGDMESVILYINECRVQIERIKNTNEPSLSTIL